MPIYDYRCEDCGNRFDRFYRSLEAEEREMITCPLCGSRKLRKLISIFGTGGTSSESCGSGPSDHG